MFYKKTLRKYFEEYNTYIANIQIENEEQRKKFKQCWDRINKISDYIQGPLQEVINKAINNYFKELEKVIEKKNKKDK